MGHAIVFLLWGIACLFCPKETMQRMMNEEAQEWYEEHGGM